MTFAVTQH